MTSENFIYESKTEWEIIGEGVRLQIMGYDEEIMLVKVEFKQNAIGYLHSHQHRQCTYVVSGIFEFQIGDENKIVEAGDGLYIEPNMNHGVRCIEKGILIDTFNPVRKDFLKYRC